jgi:hypothetical protein
MAHETMSNDGSFEVRKGKRGDKRINQLFPDKSLTTKTVKNPRIQRDETGEVRTQDMIRSPLRIDSVYKKKKTQKTQHGNYR